MDRRTFMMAMTAAGALSLKANALGQNSGTTTAAEVYQLRVYHTYEGKLDDLLARFRNHTLALFEKHGMRNVGYWVPTEEPLKGRTLFYMLAHTSREAADASWEAFRTDPEWVKVSKASEANGKLVEKVDSTFMTATDFSPHV